MTTSYTSKNGSGTIMGDYEIEQNTDKSWTTLRGKDKVHHNFQDTCASEETYVRLASIFGSNGLHTTTHFNFEDSAISVSFDSRSGRLTVVAYPEHPQYKSFPQTETEVEPTPHDHPPALGKFIVNDFLYTAPASNG